MVEKTAREKVKLLLTDGKFVEIDRDATQYIGFIREEVQSAQS